MVNYRGILDTGVGWDLFITVFVKYSEYEGRDQGDDDVVGVGELDADPTPEPQTSSAAISQVMGEHTGKYQQTLENQSSSIEYE